MAIESAKTGKQIENFQTNFRTNYFKILSATFLPKNFHISHFRSKYQMLSYFINCHINFRPRLIRWLFSVGQGKYRMFVFQYTFVQIKLSLRCSAHIYCSVTRSHSKNNMGISLNRISNSHFPMLSFPFCFPNPLN